MTLLQAHSAFRWTAVLAAVLTLEAVLPGLGAETQAGKEAPAEKQAGKPTKKPRVKVTISRETTYITCEVTCAANWGCRNPPPKSPGSSCPHLLSRSWPWLCNRAMLAALVLREASGPTDATE